MGEGGQEEMWGILLNGIGYSGCSVYYSFNHNIEYLGSVGPTPLFVMISPVTFPPLS